MSTTETTDTALGTVTLHPPHITTHYSTPIVRQTVAMPDGGVTINGVTYIGTVSLEVWPGRDYVVTDAGMVSREGVMGSWGAVTDSAREKIRAALESVGEDLLATAQNENWRREYVREQVRNSARRAARAAVRDAWREADSLGVMIDAEGEATDVLLNLTADDLTAY